MLCNEFASDVLVEIARTWPYSFTARNLEEKELYLHACVMILNVCYGYTIDLKRPFYFDIPDKNLGITKHYRAAFNGDFCQVTPTENAPKITQEDVHLTGI